MESIGKVAREHQEAVLKSLTREERNVLSTLLLRGADEQGLLRGVHPGYQHMGNPERSGKSDSNLNAAPHPLSEDSTT